MSIKLGQKVKDMISGLEGIAVSKVEYLNGCVQFGVKAELHEGKSVDVEYIDENQLSFVDQGVLGMARMEAPEKPPGGDMPDRPGR